MTLRNNEPVHAEFINVLSYQIARAVPTELPTWNSCVDVDLAFAGGVYATLDVKQLGLEVETKNHNQFIRLGQEVKTAVGKRAKHGDYDLYCVILYADETHVRGLGSSDAIYQRNVTVFADGQADRSPCGSGTCARLAILLSEGRIVPGRTKLIHRSIIGTCFEANILSESASPIVGFRACVPRVRGQANLIGHMRFLIDAEDTTFPGFLLH